MKGTVTLGDKYAGSLEQTGSRIFWATTTLCHFITIGADTSNTFVEAQAPKAPLYVSIDKQFHQWYQQKYPNKPPIPKDFVLPVQGVLQGHPESARLWAKIMDKIIKELNLQPCIHEPYLYYTKDYNPCLLQQEEEIRKIKTTHQQRLSLKSLKHKTTPLK
jgi:hypothetical protein